MGSPAGPELRCIISRPTCRQNAHNCSARALGVCVCVRGPTARPSGGVLAHKRSLFAFSQKPLASFFLLHPFYSFFFLSVAAVANSCLMVIALERKDIGQCSRGLMVRTFPLAYTRPQKHKNERGQVSPRLTLVVRSRSWQKLNVTIIKTCLN